MNNIKSIIVDIYSKNRMTYNAVTNTSNGSLLRYGASDFLNDGSFDGALETYTTDVGKRVVGIAVRYNKIVGGVLVEMTQVEKDVVDLLIDNNLSLGLNYYFTLMPKGEQENLTADGNINLTSHATRIDVNGGATMTLPDGPIQGFFKKIFNDDAQDAIITLSLDQSVSAFVSITLSNGGKAELIWDNRESFWAINEEKNLTRNT